MTEEPIKKKVRRGIAELKASLHEEIKALDAREKAQVLRLICDAHDTLHEAATYEQAKGLTTLPQTIAALKAIITALTPPTKP